MGEYMKLIKEKKFIVIVVLLVSMIIPVILFIHPYNKLGYRNGSNEFNTVEDIISTLNVSNVPYDKIVEDIIKRLKLDPNDQRVIYNIYYSGRILRFKASEIPEILGYDPEDILFAYYYNGSWHVIPSIIYDHFSVEKYTIQYDVPVEIKPNTTILLKLLSHFPEEAPSWDKNPYKTSTYKYVYGKERSAEIRLIDPLSGKSIGTIYLFIGKYSRFYNPRHLYGYRNLLLGDKFTLSEKPLIISYMEKLGYSDRDIYRMFLYVSLNELVLHKDIEWLIRWNK